MEQEKMTAEEYYRKGNEYRRQGNWQMALNNYLEAKEMLDDILNFYHKDYYNP